MTIDVDRSDDQAISIGAPADGAPAAEVARDMARRGLLVMPIVFAAVAVIGGLSAATSVAYAMAIVLVNFLLSAYLLRWAARISLGLVASVALGGYVMRLALIFMAVWIVRDAPWIRMIPLGIAIIATHLGLLVWELRHVSASFAHPGLKPTSKSKNDRGASSVERGSWARRQPWMRGTDSRPAVGYNPERIQKHRRNSGSDTTSDRAAR
ncbi:MAG: ATP synthase subunit I [Acidimicrobiia bacterium]|nr:ATP synthase subunit I [Acidimicrobiia bacterium]